MTSCRYPSPRGGTRGSRSGENMGSRKKSAPRANDKSISTLKIDELSNHKEAMKELL